MTWCAARTSDFVLRTCFGLCLCLFTVSLLHAQAPLPSGPAFEVASVKPNTSGGLRVTIQTSPGGRFTATNAPLRSLVRVAYQLQDVQLAGGPKWMDEERFDIVAKGDGNPTPDQIRAMLRTLLAERFKLTLRSETRDLPFYALVMARNDGRPGPQLRRSDAECAQAASLLDGLAPPGPPDPNAPCGFVGPGPGGGTRFRGVSAQAIGKFLSAPVHRAVLDRTGLTGYFDADLELTAELGPPPPPPGAADRFDRASAPSIFTALQEQLGLKLDSQRGPVEVFVIDRAEKPVENVSLLHAQPPLSPGDDALTFDVASIKPNNSGAVGQSVRFFPPSGRVTMTNATLRGLMMQSYGLQESQIAGGPSWIGADRFDIVANSERTNLSPPQRWVMIKALLIERFKLKTHTEPREQSVFALVLARKDGALGEHLHQSTTDCANLRPPTTPPPAFDPAHPPPCGVITGGPGRLRLRGVPMEWVAKQLSDRVGRAVVDRTGLAGYFDLDLEFAPQARLDVGDPAAADRPADTAPSLYTALTEQLGLKLDSQKNSVDVLVVDSAERPVEP